MPEGHPSAFASTTIDDGSQLRVISKFTSTNNNNSKPVRRPFDKLTFFSHSQ
jgi:hypothetical protein